MYCTGYPLFMVGIWSRGERALSTGIIVAEKRTIDAVCVLDLPDAYYSNGLYTDRISVPSSAGVTCVTMLTCSTSASPE